MSLQIEKVKEDFARRLHKAMDKKGYPQRGRARILSKKFDISDKGAGKWLNGDAIPETSKIPLLAEFLDINSEWLLSGTGEMSIQTSPSDKNNSKITDTAYSSKIHNIINDLRILDSNNKLKPELLIALESIIEMAKKS